MATFKLHIKMDNDAFASDGANGAYELARILRDVTAIVQRGTRGGHVFDMNGNRVGDWIIAKPKREAR